MELAQEAEHQSSTVVSEGNEIVEGFMIHRKPFLEVDEVDIDFALEDCERALGRPFAGDRQTAIYLVQEFLNGAALATTEQLTANQEAKIYFGISLSNEFTGQYEHGSLNLHDNTNYHLIQLSYSSLEELSRKGPGEVVQFNSSSSDEIYTQGPAWYIAHQVGVEEGAHAAYLQKHPNARGIRLAPGTSLHHYFVNNTEYDGLLWRILDAQLLQKEALNPEDQQAVAQAEALYIRQKEKADRVRRQKNKYVVDLEEFAKKHFNRL
jgi:hypothetical protein